MSHQHRGVKCPRCDDVAISRHHWNCKNCSCGYVFADGGCEYLRYGYSGDVEPEVVDVECPANA